MAPLTGNTNVPYYINTRQKSPLHIACLKNEVEFVDFLCKIIIMARENNLKIIFKPHPFEDSKVYKEAFPDLIIENDPDIKVFFKKVDVCLNQMSSANLQAFANKIPVINISNALNESERYKEIFETYPPYKLGIPVKNIEELKKLVKNNSIEDLFKMNIEREDIKVFRDIVPKYQTVDLISDALSNIDSKDNNKNYLNLIPYIIKEIYLIIMKSNRQTLFRPFSKKDKNVLKKFRIS